jgi:hypothetical protein
MTLYIFFKAFPKSILLVQLNELRAKIFSFFQMIEITGHFCFCFFFFLILHLIHSIRKNFILNMLIALKKPNKKNPNFLMNHKLDWIKFEMFDSN